MSDLRCSRGDPPAGGLRREARRHGFKGDRGKAGALLLPDRSPAAGGFQPVSACRREDRAVREGAGRAGEAGGGGDGEGVSQAIGRQEHLEGVTAKGVAGCRRSVAGDCAAKWASPARKGRRSIPFPCPDSQVWATSESSSHGKKRSGSRSCRVTPSQPSS